MLSLSWKKILLSIHIILVAVWIGTLITIIVLQLSDRFLNDITTVDKLIFFIHDQIILNASILVAFTGLIFSTFTQWGYVKFWWIITKWILIILLSLFLILFISPLVNGAAGYSDVFGINYLTSKVYLFNKEKIFYYSFIQLSSLIIIVFISTIKPWGKRKVKREPNRKLILSIFIISSLLVLATMAVQSVSLNHYRNLPIEHVDLTKIENGVYSGKVNYGSDYEVRVSLKNHKITNIEILQNRESIYAKIAEGIMYKILFENKNNVDVVTGATTTSKVLLKAVEKALLSNNK
jgi:uncharacterized protein with FMN-binding domain